MRAARSCSLAILLAGCPRPQHPVATLAPDVVEIGQDGASLRGVAGDGRGIYIAFVTGGHTTVEQRGKIGSERAGWRIDLDGAGGPLAAAGELVVASVTATGGTLRGEPASVLYARDAQTGAARWSRPFESTEWAVIASVAAGDGGIVVGGSFAGTLRAGNRVVSSAGKSDGFVARVSATGEVAWLVRVGGPNTDAVQGVAIRGEAIAIAGTFAVGANLLGEPLPTYEALLEPDDKKRKETPFADGFVAMLDAAGHRRWSATFGGKQDDAVAGVAIDASGRVAVAATVRDSVLVNNATLTVQGPSDGLVAWWSPTGQPGAAVLVGGYDFDGLHAIVAVGDRIVVGGFFSGALRLGARTLTAGGGDDAFVLALDDAGRVAGIWQAGGPGREEIAALAAVPGGFVAAVSHTAAAQLDGAAVPAPRDPMSGGALVVRPLSP